MLSIFFLLISLTGSLAQVSIDGSCPNTPPMNDFDVNKFTGTWYMIERYDNVYENNHKCAYTNCTIVDDDTIKIDFQAIVSSSGATYSWEATATPLGNKSVAQFVVEYPEYSEFRRSQLLILDTDYRTYANVWSCLNSGEMSQIYVWILSRSTNLDTDIRERAHQLLLDLDVPYGTLDNIGHWNCPPL